MNEGNFKMNQSTENPILKLTFAFAIEAVKYSEILETNKKYIISKQFLRSATSIGACVREAQNAESKLDFVHKMKIAAKEADETEYWLDICKHSEHYPECQEFLDKINEIKKVLNKIIGTTKKSVIGFQK